MSQSETRMRQYRIPSEVPA